MLTEFTQWLFDLVKKAFLALWDFVQDAFIALFGLLVDAFVALIAAIPVPDFLAGGLNQYFGSMDGGVLYAVTQCGVPQALALVGLGYVFRLGRKFVTLFQW